MDRPQMTLRQVFWLFVNSRFIITLVFIPQLRELHYTQDIIPALLLSFPMELLIGIVFVILWSRYPNHTLIEYSRLILGRWIGPIIGLLYISYFIFNTAITVRVFDEFLATRFFINTPLEVIELGILLIAAYVLYCGLEVLGRCADLLVPIIFLGLLLVIALALPQANWRQVVPTWETSLPEMLLSNFPGATRWNEYTWMAMVIPFISNKKHLQRAVYMGIGFNRLFWIILMVPIVAIFGSGIVGNLQFPTYELVEIISVGQFLERIDALVLGLWVFGAFLKIAIFYYAAVFGASQWFGMNRIRPIILPMGMIIFTLSLLLFSNVVELRNLGKSLTFFDFTFVVVIPLIMLLIHYSKKRIRAADNGNT